MAVNKPKIFLLLTVLILIGCSLSGYLLYKKFERFAYTPANQKSGQILFNIEPGQSLKTISRNLENKGLITSWAFFKWLAKFENAEKRLQAGEYLLSASFSPKHILDTLLKGRVKLYKITFPEGLNLTEVAERIEKKGFCRSDKILILCKDPEFIHRTGIKANSLEGFLFPDTYFFPKKTSCETILTTMVNRFKQVFSLEWELKAQSLNLSIFEVVTLASIIEKETGDSSERPIISSVFHNRLKKRMRLESDPTVIYGIENFDGNITRKHLQTITPYNTYKIKGLPVGPIASPGYYSLEAALFPDKTDYLFFVSKKDTTHHFSKTIQEHNRAVRKYQLNKK